MERVVECLVQARWALRSPRGDRKGPGSGVPRDTSMPNASACDASTAPAFSCGLFAPEGIGSNRSVPEHRSVEIPHYLGRDAVGQDCL
jgi:hypothetical protein